MCPDLWDSAQHLDPEVRLSLLKSAQDFYEKTNLPAPILDVYLMGSIANYNWTSDSDADVHVIIDYSKLQMPQETAAKTAKTAGAQWNQEHNVFVKGHKVEMNLQDASEPKPYVTGIYSLMRDVWIRKPSQTPPQIDKGIVQVQYKAMKSYIENAIRSGDREQMKSAKKYLDAYRQYGLDTYGELSYENIIFKILRSRGIIKYLKDSITAVYDKQMSVDELREQLNEISTDKKIKAIKMFKNRIEQYKGDFSDEEGQHLFDFGVKLTKQSRTLHVDRRLIIKFTLDNPLRLVELDVNTVKKTNDGKYNFIGLARILTMSDLMDRERGKTFNKSVPYYITVDRNGTELRDDITVIDRKNLKPYIDEIEKMQKALSEPIIPPKPPEPPKPPQRPEEVKNVRPFNVIFGRKYWGSTRLGFTKWLYKMDSVFSVGEIHRRYVDDEAIYTLHGMKRQIGSPKSESKKFSIDLANLEKFEIDPTTIEDHIFFITRGTIEMVKKEINNAFSSRPLGTWTHQTGRTTTTHDTSGRITHHTGRPSDYSSTYEEPERQDNPPDKVSEEYGMEEGEIDEVSPELVKRALDVAKNRGDSRGGRLAKKFSDYINKRFPLLEVREKDILQSLPGLSIKDDPVVGDPKFDRSYWDKINPEGGNVRLDRITMDELKAFREKALRFAKAYAKKGQLDLEKIHNAEYKLYDAELKRRVQAVNALVEEGYGSGMPEDDRLKIKNTDGSTRRWQIRSKDAPKTPKMTDTPPRAIEEFDDAQKETLTEISLTPSSEEGENPLQQLFKHAAEASSRLPVSTKPTEAKRFFHTTLLNIAKSTKTMAVAIMQKDSGTLMESMHLISERSHDIIPLLKHWAIKKIKEYPNSRNELMRLASEIDDHTRQIRNHMHQISNNLERDGNINYAVKQLRHMSEILDNTRKSIDQLVDYDGTPIPE